MAEGSIATETKMDQNYISGWLKTLPYDTNEQELFMEDILAIVREIILRDAKPVLLVAIFVKKMSR